MIKTDRNQHLAKNCVQEQLEVQGTINRWREITGNYIGKDEAV